jgi:hypothetical protein
MCAKLVDPAPASAARARGPAVAGATSMLVGHGPLRAACGRDRVAAVGLRWTCDPRSFAGVQR